jgi:hypothetical protein
MQPAVENIERLGQMSVRPEYMCDVAPTHLDWISPCGTFDFPVADFAHRLMPSLVAGIVASSQRSG